MNVWRNWCRVCLVGLFFPGALIACAASPRIVVEPSVFEFGELLAGKTVAHEFVIENRGDAVLKITGVRAECGCTTVSGDQQQIAAGESGKISIVLNTSGLEGEVYKRLQVDSNDPNESSLMLSVKGFVKKPVTLEPATGALFAQLEAGEANSTTVVLTNNLDTPLEIESVVGDSTRFSGEVKTVDEDKVLELTVTAVPPFTPGQTLGKLLLKTKEHGILVVDVVARYQPVRIEPAEGAVFSPADPEQPETKVVHILNTQKKPLEIESVKSRSKRFKTALKVVEPGKEYELKVTTVPPLKVGSTNSVIQLQTTSSKKYQLFVRAAAKVPREDGLHETQ